MTYTATKTYGHERGLSCVFRQWRAESHCRHLHGYALGFTFTFTCTELDQHGWVIDFGSMDPVLCYLRDMFDHTLLVADDDPFGLQLLQLNSLERLVSRSGAPTWHTGEVAETKSVPAVGCEAFARMVHAWTAAWLVRNYGSRVRLDSVECREHGANSATYRSVG